MMSIPISRVDLRYAQFVISDFIITASSDNKRAGEPCGINGGVAASGPNHKDGVINSSTARETL